MEPQQPAFPSTLANKGGNASKLRCPSLRSVKTTPPRTPITFGRPLVWKKAHTHLGAYANCGFRPVQQNKAPGSPLPCGICVCCSYRDRRLGSRLAGDLAVRRRGKPIPRQRPTGGVLVTSLAAEKKGSISPQNIAVPCHETERKQLCFNQIVSRFI